MVATTTIEGMGQLRRALAAVPEVARGHVASAVATTVFAVQQRARSLVPVLSGDLKRSIGTSKSRNGLSGGVGVSSPATFYWRFTEFGTRYAPARPFFRPAAESEQNDFVQRLRAIGPRLERDLSVGRLL